MQSGNALGGHYISFVRSYNQWYLCNDFSINKVSLKNMQTIARSGFYKTFQPVLFFYEQIKPKSIIRKKTHADAKKITPKKKAKK